MLDAKAKKWLHPGIGGSKVRAVKGGLSRAELIAHYRSTFDEPGWRLGLGRAGELRGLQLRAIELLASKAEAPEGFEVDLEAALVQVAHRAATEAVQVWVREAGLAFALEALWRKAWLAYDFEYGKPVSRYSLKNYEKNFRGGPDDAWWVLRRLAACASPDEVAKAVSVGERLLDDGGPTLDAFIALVLPQPAWVERALSQGPRYWDWSLVLTVEQAEASLAAHAHSDAGRMLMSFHVADLVDRLGAKAAPSLEALKGSLEADLSAYKRGNRDLQLAVARVEHMLSLIAGAGARGAAEVDEKSSARPARVSAGRRKR